MKKRPALQLERLEARETPDVSLGSASAPPVSGLVSKGAFVDLHSGAPAKQPSLATPVVAAEDLYDRVAAALAQVDAYSEPSAVAHALRAIFSNPAELERLLDEVSAAPGSAATYLDLAPAQAAAPGAIEQGLRLLENYTRKAIRNAEQRFGRLPDHDDIVHDVYVKWREQVGPDDHAFTRLLEQTSAERQVMVASVRRVIDKARYEFGKQRRNLELFDHPAPERPFEQDWIDLKLDWEMEGPKQGPRALQLLELRRQGLTFEEIGSELGLLKQRVCELYNSTITRLQELYCPA